MARTSAQNSGPPPKTTPIGGKNFQPDAMNPDLWPVFNDEGRRMINARIRRENTRFMGGGLDAFNLVNSPYGKSIGLGYKQAEAGIQGIRSGMPDPNRALFNLNPYAAQSPVQPQGPNPDQMRWAQAFANDRKPTATPSAPDQSLGGAAFGNTLTPTATAGAPSNFSRAALIEGAKKSGEFTDIMNAYNRNAQGTGYRMDKNGNINPLSKSADAQGTSPFAREVYGPGAQDIAARRDFARGEAPVQFSGPTGSSIKGGFADQASMLPFTKQAPGTMALKQNPYGSASSSYGLPSTGSIMKHEITGKMVPMSPYLAEKRAIQDTKNKPLGSQDANRFRDLVRKGRMA